MERVLEKPTAAERKFGLLSCEHAFCLGCIRGWRSHHEGGADTNTVSLGQVLYAQTLLNTQHVLNTCSNMWSWQRAELLKNLWE